MGDKMWGGSGNPPIRLSFFGFQEQVLPELISRKKDLIFSLPWIIKFISIGKIPEDENISLLFFFPLVSYSFTRLPKLESGFIVQVFGMIQQPPAIMTLKELVVHFVHSRRRLMHKTSGAHSVADSDHGGFPKAFLQDLVMSQDFRRQLFQATFYFNILPGGMLVVKFQLVESNQSR